MSPYKIKSVTFDGCQVTIRIINVNEPGWFFETTLGAYQLVELLKLPT